MDISISCQKQILSSFRFFSFFFSFFFVHPVKHPPFLFFGFVFWKDYPCLCLCLGLEQITIIRPRLRISRHFSQILRTEALIFIFVIP